MRPGNKRHLKERVPQIYKKSGLYIVSVAVLFILIGALTTAQPAYRISSAAISNWTSDIDGAVFLNLIGMENKAFNQALSDENHLPSVSNSLFQIVTNLKPNDPRSLLGNEIPGFSVFDRDILIAGEGTDYTNLPYESSPPLEEVLRDREAVMDEPEEEEHKPDENMQSTGDRDVVFIYNTHNRESFLPHLPGEDNPNLAQHDEVNITLVSERLANGLEAKGIGTQVDDTDIIGTILPENDMEYWQSYDASRNIVEEAFASNQDIQYVFDIHRDSLTRDKTTTEINGESYARIMFVYGEDNPNHEKNMEIASEIHYLVEEKYPGLSRGVVPQGGAGNNGVYNQDLSENAMLIEFGGLENNLEELYRTADALAEVFSEFYWDAESVDANP